MYAIYYVSLATIFLVNQCLGQDACPPLPPSACNVISRPKAETNGLHCDALGFADNPVTVKDTCITANFADCRNYCLDDTDCHSFSFKAGQINAGSCSLYNGSVINQGFHSNDSSITQFSNRHCYRYDCPSFDCPSSSFHLQVSNRGSKYTNWVLTRPQKLVSFTSNITEASTFRLNSDCQIISHGRLGSDGVNRATPPGSVNGPLYFFHGKETKKKNFSLAKCAIDSTNFKFTCSYGHAGGSSDETFFSCEGVLGLGTYPGDAACQSGNGNVTLTAFNFHGGAR